MSATHDRDMDISAKRLTTYIHNQVKGMSAKHHTVYLRVTRESFGSEDREH